MMSLTHVNASGSGDGVNYSLPERVFGRRGFPTNGRLNIYSTLDYLGLIAQNLAGTTYIDTLMESQFGKLFKFQVSLTSHSGILLHSLLCRQVIKGRKHVLCFVFGGQPMRFSLREFHISTGLNCGPIPSDEIVAQHKKNEDTVWEQLVGDKPDANKNVSYIADLLKQELKLESDSNEKMCEWKKFYLCLILLVDGVLVCSNKYGTITEKYVEMLGDGYEFFLSYPWGRDAFIHTIERFGPPKESKTDPIEELKTRLHQGSNTCYGFPLALQMQAFQEIPLLLPKLPGSRDKRDYTEMTYEEIEKKTILHQKHISQVEEDEQLDVAYTLVGEEGVEEIDFGWDDDDVDEKLDYMEKLIKEKHKFTESEWPGGDTATPCVKGKKSGGLGKKGDKKNRPRRVEEDKIPAKKQRHSKTEAVDNVKLLKELILEQHKEIVKEVREELMMFFGRQERGEARGEKRSEARGGSDVRDAEDDRRREEIIADPRF